jgi:ankyrin repeat protein
MLNVFSITACTKSPTTCLHLAAGNGHDDALLVLFSKARDANVRDKNGMTPLALAAANGHKNSVSVLVEQGALVCSPCGPHRYSLDLMTHLYVLEIIVVCHKNNERI